MARRAKQYIRVIAGTLKGRRLCYPPGSEIRPSMQQTKAAIFDSIRGTLQGAIFLDLFAGAGGVGIEAISRGAAFAHFVEVNPEALRCLEENLAICSLGGDRARIHPVSVFDFLAEESIRAMRPDIIYADPPYEGEDISSLLAILERLRYHRTRLIILEHRKDLPVEASRRLARTKLKKFGQTWVSFFVPTRGEEK